MLFNPSFETGGKGQLSKYSLFFSHDPPPQGEKLERRCEFLDELKRLE